MKFLVMGLCFTTTLLAAEVATIENLPGNRDLSLTITDEGLFKSAEQQLLIQPCRLKVTTSNQLREITVPNACRAEMIKLFINSGYKPLNAMGTIYTK